MLRDASRGEGGEVDAILEGVARLVGGPGPWMDSKEAAEFLRMNHSVFKEMAAKDEIPRHEVRPGRYRYYAPELTEWLLAR